MSTAPGKAKIKSKKRLSDPELVKACLKGDESAWTALIDKYKNLIFSIPIRYGFSEDDSADIFQAVCMDLLNELTKVREPKALAGWLIQVTKNKCFHRKKSLQRSKVQPIDDPNAFASLEEPEGLAVQVEQEQILRNAMAVLPDRCQQLVRMLFFEMPVRPYHEVAKDLELASGSIGFIRRRCLDKLKDRLEEMGFHLP
jgi:RNA polymerase sigma factor (sigma-70 family)